MGFSCISELPLPSGRRRRSGGAETERGEIWIVEIKSSIEDLRPTRNGRTSRPLRPGCSSPSRRIGVRDFPEQTGLIVSDAYGAHMNCEAPEHRLPARPAN